MLRRLLFYLVVLAIVALVLWYLAAAVLDIKSTVLTEYKALFWVVLGVVVAIIVLRFWGAAILIGTYKVINLVIPWHKLPLPLSVLNLDAFRFRMRKRNLYDTPSNATEPLPWNPSVVTARTADGSYNDLSEPNMGRAGMRFGRNFPIDKTHPDYGNLFRPNPREISRKLMTRDIFRPAETLNMLAAAWIQFMVHGWMNHEQQVGKYHPIPLPEGDDWHEDPMKIRKTLPDSPETGDAPPTFVNTESHWWDESQVYGSDLDRQKSLRTGESGKMNVKDGRLLEQEEARLKGIDQTGFFDNYWVGLSMFHTLFTLEHNAICDALAQAYPTWEDAELFETARLINCALIAKIHTVEWTPALLAHPTLRVSMNANWWGLFGERIRRTFGRLSDREELSGLMGSPTDHHAASFSLTEEFTAVYRMHPLIPDVYDFYCVSNGDFLETLGFGEIEANNTRPVIDRIGMDNLIYSFGLSHPGAITLHNFPRSLQRLKRLDSDEGTFVDLASIDILRDRERGIPRYNQFRKLCHMRPVKSFDQLTANPQWAKEMAEVYDHDIDLVDTMVGLLAEPPPKGFAFSDTAFRIFVLMASRRLKSDRFFTIDYRPEVYTQLGLDWIDDNELPSVLLRHYPSLAPVLYGVTNGFAPWSTVRLTKPIER